MRTVYEKNIETTEEPKIDLSILRKRGNSKTFSGYLIQKMKEAKADENIELVALIEHFYKKYIEFAKSERVWLESWKGKSSLRVVEQPDKFILITFQRENQDSTPKEVKREITKEEVNEVIESITKLNKNKIEGSKLFIPTREIGEMTYRKDWDTIFADRYLHTQLNLILRLLDYKKQIKYRGGRSLVLK